MLKFSGPRPIKKNMDSLEFHMKVTLIAHHSFKQIDVKIFEFSSRNVLSASHPSIGLTGNDLPVDWYSKLSWQLSFAEETEFRVF